MNCVISKKSLILFAHCCFRDEMSHVNGVLKLTDGFFSLFILQLPSCVFLIIPEKDYPPVARAGNDVVIVLPVDHVTLYGNGSTDDKVLNERKRR